MLAYQRDPRYLRFYPRTDRTEAEVRDFVHMFVDQQAEIPLRKFQLAVTLSYDHQRAIDSCRIRLKSENEWEADIGYELAPEHWGEGYATEAALAIVSFGFRELKLHRVSSWCIATTRRPPGSWRRQGCVWRAVCGPTSILKGTGGILCSSERWKMNGEIRTPATRPRFLLTRPELRGYNHHGRLTTQ